MLRELSQPLAKITEKRKVRMVEAVPQGGLCESYPLALGEVSRNGESRHNLKAHNIVLVREKIVFGLTTEGSKDGPDRLNCRPVVPSLGQLLPIPGNLIISDHKTS